MALAPCMIAVADSVIFAACSPIDFELSISLVRACLYSASSAAALLEAFDDLFVIRQYRAKRVIDEFEPRQRAGRDRLVGIDDECVGERRHRLELIGYYLGAELDRLLFRIVGVAGKIVELVAQHIAAAHQLVLRQPCAFLLDPEDLGEDLAEVLEFLVQPRDLVAPRRVGRCPSSIDRSRPSGWPRPPAPPCRPLPCRSPRSIAPAPGRRSARGRYCAPDRLPTRCCGRSRRRRRRARSRDRRCPCWRPRSPARRQSRA